MSETDDEKDKRAGVPSKAEALSDFAAVPSTEGRLFPKIYLRSQTKLVEEKGNYSQAATRLVDAETERANALTRLGRAVRRLEHLPEILEEDDLEWDHQRKVAKLAREKELKEAQLNLEKAKEDAATQKVTKKPRRDLEVRRLQAQERLESYDIAHTERQIKLEESGDDDDSGPSEESL